MRKILLLLILFLLVFITGPECKIPSKPVMKKLASFPDILKPGMIIVRGGRLYKELYEYFKNTIVIAPHFPVIASIFVRDEKVYVLTNNEVDQMWEMFLYDLEGVFIKKLFVPLLKRDLLSPFPTDIRNGNVYQLIENEENEMWELHVTGIQ